MTRTAEGMNAWVAAVVAGLLTVLAASTGVISSPGEWYQSLEKPPLNPPSWVFGTVWTPLYVLIAIAGALCLARSRSHPSLAGLWVAQIILNGLWTILFFGLRQPEAALAELVVLLAVVLVLVVRAWSVDRRVSWLLIPYLAWMSFAAYLNAGVAVLN